MKRAKCFLLLIILPLILLFTGAMPSTVYITETGDCYHMSYCHSLNKSKRAISRYEAERLGYRPCYYCMDEDYESNINDGIFSDGSSSGQSGTTPPENSCSTGSIIGCIFAVIIIGIYGLSFWTNRKK